MQKTSIHKTSRRKFLETLPALGAARSLVAAPPNEILSFNAHTLWYSRPATRWEEALPCGNGRLGAMIFGGIQRERLQLNEITVWSGKLEAEADRPEAYKSLEPIRQQIAAGQYAEASKAMNAQRTCLKGGEAGVGTYGSYQTLGDLTFDFGEPAEPVTNYRRWLNIDEASAGVNYTVGKDQWSRELISSAPAQALVVKVTCSRAGAVNFTVSLTRQKWANTRPEGKNTLVMTGTSTGQPGDLRYEAQVRVVTTGGSVESSNGTLIVKGANEAAVFLVAGSDYVLDYAKSYKGADPHQSVTATLDRVARRPFNQLKREHVSEYSRYFQRLSLNLGQSENAALATDERLRRFSAGANDPSLVKLFYQYGRYLLISSSRPDNVLPSNSQGIWGDGLKLPWGCDYKSNINFQMNYWPAETANLSECHRPMLRLIESLVEPGIKTAQTYFKAPGWVMAYTTNPWGWTAPGGSGPWGPFFCGGAWACQHLWEHYAFSQDREYLKSVYPVMRSACEACLDMLVKDANGNLITSPSTSPENTFQADNGQRGWACAGAAMERQIISELFANTATAAAVLKTDDEFRKKLLETRHKIRPPQVGKAGQLMEWGEDWDMNAPETHHRHISHLFALHPGREISPLRTPALAEATRKTLDIRGDESTGWSKAWKINCWARLHDGDRALKLIREQLKAVDTTETNYRRGGGTYLNLLDAHPPFQIDGNFGAVSGVNEMLLQSHLPIEDENRERYLVHFLPALPSAWKNGSIRGLRARGGATVNLAWKEGKATEVVLQIDNESPWQIRAPKGQSISEISSGKRTLSLDRVNANTVGVHLPKGEYRILFS